MAVQFNAASDALRNNSGVVPANNSAYTVGGWVKANSTPDPTTFFASDAAGNGCVLSLNSNQLIAHNGGYSTLATVGGAWTNNKWYFVAMRVNGTTVTVSRGDETTACVHGSGTCPTQGSTFRVWVGGTPDSFFPIVDLAHWFVYDAVLSDAEIEAQRLSPTLVRTSNVTADWEFATAATKLVDRHGGAQPLVAVGAGPWADAADPTLSGGTASGTGAVTLGNATGSGAGIFSATPLGTGARTLANTTGVGAGSASPAGTGARTLGNAAPASIGWALPPYAGGGATTAVAFNAAADALRNNSAVVPANNSAYTVGGWIRTHSTQDPTTFFESDAAGNGMSLSLNGGVLVAHNGGFSTLASVAGALTDNHWYFVALRVNGLAVDVYRGDETTAVTKGSGTCAAQGGTFRVWLGGTSAAWFPTADMALWWVYDAVLTDGEVEAQRLSATLARTTNVTADWPLASNATKLVDRHGGTQPLVAVGAGPWSDVSDGPSLGTATVVGVSIAVLGTATGAAAGTFSSGTPVGTGASSLANTAGASSGTANAPSVTGAGARSLANTTNTGSGIVGQGPLDFSVLMPLISRGKPVFGTGTPAQMVDGKYGYVDGVAIGAWACTAASWVAIQVGAGPSQVLIGLSNDNAAGGSYLANVFEAYRIQFSSNSTNGSDGTWTTVATITGNPAMNREHKLTFTGYSWVKLIVDTCSGGQLDELNVWDATNGTPDTFAFLGDSITDGLSRRSFWFGGGFLPSFQENVQTNRPGHHPLQCNVGVTGQGAAYWATNIASALALYPDVKYWCVTIGVNDGSSMPGALSTWSANMTTVLNAITAAGRTPILSRTTWTGAGAYGGGAYLSCGLRTLNDSGVDVLATSLGLRKGPDLFALTYNSGTDIYAVASDPHPNNEGYKALSLAWANSLGADTTTTGTGARTLNDTTGSSTGARGEAGSGAVSLANTTGAASGTVTRTGTGAVTLATVTTTAAGSTTRGTGAATLAGAAGAGAGTLTTAGVGVATLSGVSTTGQGRALATGTNAQVLANTTSASAGTFTAASITGTASATLAPTTGASTGAHASFVGAGAVALALTTGTGVAARGQAGTAASVLAGATPSAVGYVSAIGSSTVVLAGAVGTGVGLASVGDITGAGVQVLGVTTGWGWGSTSGGLPPRGSGGGFVRARDARVRGNVSLG